MFLTFQWCPTEELDSATGAREKLESALRNKEWGAAYTEDSVVRSAPAGQVVRPLALYVDGVPFQRRGSLLAFLCTTWLP